MAIINGTPQDNDKTSQSYWDKRWDRPRFTNALPQRSKDLNLRKVLDLATNGTAGGTVCEIGCAPGSMIVRMSSLRPDLEYHGIDYSEIGISKTKKLTEKARVPTKLHCVDYLTHAPEKLFDLVVSFGFIEHALDPVMSIRRHMEFVQPGGHVAVSIPNYGHPFVAAMALRIDPEVFSSHNINIMDTAELEKAMHEAGLRNVQVWQSGKAKLRTSCPDRTRQRLAWRLVAKGWNIFARCLPSGYPWHTTLWAAGKRP